MNLVHLLDEIATRSPNTPALISPDLEPSGTGRRDGTLTYGDLRCLVDATAATLRTHGISTGDRVVVLLPISAPLYVVLLALMRLAATGVLIEPSMGVREMERSCRLAEPSAFIAAPKGHALRLAAEAFRAIPLQFVLEGPRLPGSKRLEIRKGDHHSAVLTVDATDETPALITFTTGNTGSAKAMSRSHGFLWAQHLALAAAIPFLPGDVDYSTFPIFVLDNLASEVPTVLPPTRPRPPDPAQVVRQIAEHRVTTIRGSPSFFAMLAGHCHTRGIKLDSVRALLTGGAPVGPKLVSRLQGLLPNAKVVVAYGSTEVEPICLIPGEEIVSETGALTAQGQGYCVGKPVPSLDVAIIRFQEGRVGLGSGGLADLQQPQGVPGEVVVSGEQVNPGYFRDPNATANSKFVDETGRLWHRTGDAGYFDEKGRLWLVGRVASRVVRAGRELHPAQVEPLVDALPFVQRTALVGVPDPRLGQRAVLVVATFANGEMAARRNWPGQRQAIARRCHELGLPIDEICRKRSIPVDRHGRGKIQYDRLRAWYGRGRLGRWLA